jgi:hypothetical protein
MTTTEATSTTAGCSFCLRPNTEVGRLVAGPGVFICGACVSIASQVLAGTAAQPTVAPRDIDLSLETILALLEPIAAAETQARRSLNLGMWVTKARELGATWSQVGEALGITRQSAWERFSTEE